jgi:hypothetical protein
MRLQNDGAVKSLSIAGQYPIDALAQGWVFEDGVRPNDSPVVAKAHTSSNEASIVRVRVRVTTCAPMLLYLVAVEKGTAIVVDIPAVCFDPVRAEGHHTQGTFCEQFGLLFLDLLGHGFLTQPVIAVVDADSKRGQLWHFSYRDHDKPAGFV